MTQTTIYNTVLFEYMQALELRVEQLEHTVVASYKKRNQREVQDRVARLEDENKLLRQQLEQFQSSHMAVLSQRRTATLQKYRDEYEQEQKKTRSEPQGQVVSDVEDEEILDVPMSQPVRENNSASNRPFLTQQSTLECPKCHQHFSVEDPVRFLEHKDQCELLRNPRGKQDHIVKVN